MNTCFVANLLIAFGTTLKCKNRLCIARAMLKKASLIFFSISLYTTTCMKIVSFNLHTLFTAS